MDATQKHRQLISLATEAMMYSESKLAYEDPNTRALFDAQISIRLRQMDNILQELGECPMCGQEVGGVEKAEADCQALEEELNEANEELVILGWEAAHHADRHEDETPEYDAFREEATNGTCYNATIVVETVDGTFDHMVENTRTIGQAAETAYNLYMAGVEDGLKVIAPVFKNPPLRDAVKITLIITKETY